MFINGIKHYEIDNMRISQFTRVCQCSRRIQCAIVLIMRYYGYGDDDIKLALVSRFCDLEDTITPEDIDIAITCDSCTDALQTIELRNAYASFNGGF